MKQADRSTLFSARSTPRLLALALSAFTAGAWGRQDHLSTQESYAICQELQAENPSANAPESFHDCVACYETCGNDCQVLATSPASYACPDEIGAGGASGDDGAGGGGGGGG